MENDNDFKHRYGYGLRKKGKPAQKIASTIRYRPETATESKKQEIGGKSPHTSIAAIPSCPLQ